MSLTLFDLANKHVPMSERADIPTEVRERAAARAITRAVHKRRRNAVANTTTVDGDLSKFCTTTDPKRMIKAQLVRCVLVYKFTGWPFDMKDGIQLEDFGLVTGHQLKKMLGVLTKDQLHALLR